MLPILIVLKFLNMVQLEVEFHYESSAQVTTVELTISNQTCLQYMKIWDLFRKNALISETYICIQSQKLFPMLAKNAKRSLHNQSHTMVCFITGSRDEPKRSRMMIGGLSNQLYLKNFRLEALTAYHDNKAGGAHFWVEKCMATLKRKYHWPRMHQEINDYIQSCERCQTFFNL